MLLKLPSNIVGKLSPNIAIYCLVRTKHKRTFLNDLGQIHEVCSFEDIGQSRFHAKLFKNAHNCRRKQNFEHCPTQPSESRIYFYHGVIILNRSNNSQISIETSAPLRKQVVLL